MCTPARLERLGALAAAADEAAGAQRPAGVEAWFIATVCASLSALARHGAYTPATIPPAHVPCVLCAAHAVQELRAGTWLPVAASQAVIMDVLKGERAAMCPAPCLQAERVPDFMRCLHLL